MIFRKRLTKEQRESIIENIEHVGIHGEINVKKKEVIEKLFPGLVFFNKKKGEIDVE